MIVKSLRTFVFQLYCTLVTNTGSSEHSWIELDVNN